MHIRAQIRAALAALFDGDVPASFKFVDLHRAHASDLERLPLLAIAWSSEDITGNKGGGDWRVTQWTLSIHCAGPAAADSADALAALVETRIGADDDLGGLVAHVRMRGSSLAISGETEKRTATLAVHVETAVLTEVADPENRA